MAKVCRARKGCRIALAANPMALLGGPVAAGIAARIWAFALFAAGMTLGRRDGLCGENQLMRR